MQVNSGADNGAYKSKVSLNSDYHYLHKMKTYFFNNPL